MPTKHGDDKLQSTTADFPPSSKMRRLEDIGSQCSKRKVPKSTNCTRVQQALPPQQLSPPISPVCLVPTSPVLSMESSNSPDMGHKKLGPMTFRVKEDVPFEYRAAESAKVRGMYPDRIPIVVQRLPGSTVGELQKPKFLVPDNICVDQFIWILKEKLGQPGVEVSIFINNEAKPPPGGQGLRCLFEQLKDKDGFLYVAYGDADSKLQS